MTEQPNTWSVRLMPHTSATGAIEYAFHEVYFEEGGKIRGWTSEAISPLFASRAACREWLSCRLSEPDNGVACGEGEAEIYHHSDFEYWLEFVDAPLFQGEG